MTPGELIAACEQAKECGGRITLSFKKGTKSKLPGFPRGELLSENQDGTRNYSYDGNKVLAWVEKRFKECQAPDQPPT